MRIIKLAIISIALLFIAATAISLLIPSDIRISKAINLHSQPDSIWPLIRNRDKWPQWHPAFINNAPQISSIKSIVLHQDDSLYEIKLQQDNKRPVVNGWRFYNASQDSITLQWYMDFHMGPMPWQKLSSLFFENTYGMMMQEGLTNIKKKVEGNF